MARRRSPFPLVFLILYIVMIWVGQSHTWIINNSVWSWLIVSVLTITVLVVFLPLSLFRRIGQMVGHVIRKVEHQRQRSRGGVHEEERSYEQGYQANFSNAAQELPVTPDTYELPQAQYPQQQQPPM